jgi:hypothetical protein
MGFVYVIPVNDIIPNTSAATSIIILSSIGTEGAQSLSPQEEEDPILPDRKTTRTFRRESPSSFEKTAAQQNTSKTVNKNFSRQFS